MLFLKIQFTFSFFEKHGYYLFINKDQLNQVHQKHFIVVKIINSYKANFDTHLQHFIHYLLTKFDLMNHLYCLQHFPMIILIFMV